MLNSFFSFYLSVSLSLSLILPLSFSYSLMGNISLTIGNRLAFLFLYFFCNSYSSSFFSCSGSSSLVQLFIFYFLLCVVVIFFFFTACVCGNYYGSSQSSYTKWIPNLCKRHGTRPNIAHWQWNGNLLYVGVEFELFQIYQYRP